MAAGHYAAFDLIDHLFVARALLLEFGNCQSFIVGLNIHR
jgi:hypothetical protein